MVDVTSPATPRGLGVGGVQVNDAELATIPLKGERPDEFVELIVPLPSELSARARNGISVKLVARGERAARLFDLRLLEASSGTRRPLTINRANVPPINTVPLSSNTVGSAAAARPRVPSFA